MRLAVRQKLVLLSLLIVVVVSFTFTLLHLRFTRQLVEEDLAERAVVFAREIAATIGDRRELESGPLLERQIAQIMDARTSVLQLDILVFTGDDVRLIATSNPRARLPLTRADTTQVRRRRPVSRLIADRDGRYWEVMAPVVLDGTVAGAVAGKFSVGRADQLVTRSATWALLLTAASVVVMGVLMSVAVQFVVNRPIGRFLAAIRDVQRGHTVAAVDVRTLDEFGVLARHFNEMMARIHDFSNELQTRIKEATHELEGRYREVERLNELLFAMQRSLGHAERLALSGRIIAEVAHELGTPLHSVAGHLELLRQDLPPALASDAVLRRLTVIESQLTRVTEIIAQLMDLSRREPGPRVAVDLNRLVQDTIELVRPGFVKHGLALDVTTDPALPHVLGHAHQLQQIVLNLITNAMDATPPGGRVSVTTSRRPGVAELEVHDTGRGIPAAQQKLIFEPFFSTKKPGRGTGLGLFISAQIVREHQGRMDLTSAEGRGSTFRLQLPASA
jgi:two-component system NtrC family sensor kinase